MAASGFTHHPGNDRFAEVLAEVLRTQETVNIHEWRALKPRSSWINQVYFCNWVCFTYNVNQTDAMVIWHELYRRFRLNGAHEFRAYHVPPETSPEWRAVDRSWKPGLWLRLFCVSFAPVAGLI